MKVLQKKLYKELKSFFWVNVHMVIAATIEALIMMMLFFEVDIIEARNRENSITFSLVYLWLSSFLFFLSSMKATHLLLSYFFDKTYDLNFTFFWMSLPYIFFSIVYFIQYDAFYLKLYIAYMVLTSLIYFFILPRLWKEHQEKVEKVIFIISALIVLPILILHFNIYSFLCWFTVVMAISIGFYLFRYKVEGENSLYQK